VGVQDDDDVEHSDVGRLIASKQSGNIRCWFLGVFGFIERRFQLRSRYTTKSS
jgi:hypothetical protein